MANAPVGRLLHPGEIAAVAQHAGDQVDSLVDPFGDKNLICLTLNAARYSQIVHQRVLQLGRSAVTAVAELFRFGRRLIRAWILLNSGWGNALTSGTPGINAPTGAGWR
jgi:hypothetical protein